jgi:hypothetical protein
LGPRVTTVAFLGDKHTAFDLVRFDRLEKRLEIAFAKTLVALAGASSCRARRCHWEWNFFCAASICCFTASMLKVAPFCIGGKFDEGLRIFGDLLLDVVEPPELVDKKIIIRERTPLPQSAFQGARMGRA